MFKDELKCCSDSRIYVEQKHYSESLGSWTLSIIQYSTFYILHSNIRFFLNYRILHIQ
jgi:hypothetical protein